METGRTSGEPESSQPRDSTSEKTEPVPTHYAPQKFIETVLVNVVAGKFATLPRLVTLVGKFNSFAVVDTFQDTLIHAQ
jgi:hypothetical protein